MSNQQEPYFGLIPRLGFMPTNVQYAFYSPVSVGPRNDYNYAAQQMQVHLQQQHLVAVPPAPQNQYQHAIQQRLQIHQSQQQQTQLQTSHTPSQPRPNQTSRQKDTNVVPLSKEQTNIKLIQKIEKYEGDNKMLSHLIDGHLIIESSQPLTLDPPIKKKSKSKSIKSKKKCKVTSTPTQQTIQTPNQSAIQLQQSTPSQTPILNRSAPAIVERDHKTMPTTQLRAEMSSWSVDEVSKFIASHDDIKEQSAKFLDDEVDGKALLLLIDKNLNIDTLTKTLQFKIGPAIKIVDTLTKYKLED